MEEAMGRISKAIKLKLQELRIDDIFKEGILKYKEMLSNDEAKNEGVENNSEKNNEESENNSQKDTEDNNGVDINSITKNSDGASNYSEECNDKEHNIIQAENVNSEKENIEKSEMKVFDKKDIDSIDNKFLNRSLNKNKSLKEEKVLEKKETLKQTNQTLKIINKNETMMQYFEWHYPNDGSLWNKVKENSKSLSEIGITALWLPPACKAADGIYDAGYGLYDLYDLGEFDQKGTIRTKYGTKHEYIKAIEEVHKYNIKIYGDVVFNHKGGADEYETVSARPVSNYNRNEFIGEKREIQAHTVFKFPGRGNKYSAYKWTASDFDGVDFDENTKEQGIFKFEGKEWEKDVDLEYGNYDFLMYADLDMDSPYVVEELKRWGKWYLEETGVDGFRLDAIKHI
jgi:alpha-amylase